MKFESIALTSLVTLIVSSTKNTMASSMMTGAKYSSSNDGVVLSNNKNANNAQEEEDNNRILTTDEENAALGLPPDSEEEDIDEDFEGDENDLVVYDNYGCTLECQNKGICEVLTYIEQHHKNTIPQRCICPPGYGGILCDIQISSCFTSNNDEHFCQNGAPCVFVDEKNDNSNNRRSRALSQQVPSCDCRQAYDTSAFAGHECAYPASEYCTETSDLSLRAFCTNGGSCKGYVKDPVNDNHPGCDCMDEYEGQHCEYIKGTERIAKDTIPNNDFVVSDSFSSTEEEQGGQVFFGILITLFVCSLLGLAIMVRRWRIRTLAEREIVRQANFVTAELTLRCMKRQSPGQAPGSGSSVGGGSVGGGSVGSNYTSESGTNSNGGYNRSDAEYMM